MFPTPLGEFHFHPSFNWETEVQGNEGNGLKDDSVSQQPDQEAGALTAGFLVSSINIRVHSLQRGSFPGYMAGRFRSFLGEAWYLTSGTHTGGQTLKFLPRWGFPLPSPALLSLENQLTQMPWLPAPSVSLPCSRSKSSGCTNQQHSSALEPQNSVVPQCVPKASNWPMCVLCIVKGWHVLPQTILSFLTTTRKFGNSSNNF